MNNLSLFYRDFGFPNDFEFRYPRERVESEIIDTTFLLKVPVPGVNKNNIDVKLDGDEVVIIVNNDTKYLKTYSAIKSVTKGDKTENSAEIRVQLNLVNNTIDYDGNFSMNLENGILYIYVPIKSLTKNFEWKS